MPTPSPDELTKALSKMGLSLTDAFSKLGASAALAGSAFEKFGEAMGKVVPFDVADSLSKEQAALLAQAPTADPMVTWMEQEIEDTLDAAVQAELKRAPKFEPPPEPGKRRIDLDE